MNTAGLIAVTTLAAAIGVACTGLVLHLRRARRERAPTITAASPFEAPDPDLVAQRDARLVALGPRPPWWQPIARWHWRRSRAAILATDVSATAAMLSAVYSSDRVRELAERPQPSAVLTP